MPNTYESGVGGDWIYNGATIPVQEWSLNQENALTSVANTSGIADLFVTGITTSTVSFKAFWDSTNIATGATIDMEAGLQDASTLKLGATGKTFTGTLIIKKLNVVNNVNGGIAFNVEGNFTGPVTTPT